MTDRAARGRAAHRAGLDAEETAARLAAARGLTVVERRYRSPHGEIDLIATAPGLVVFIEVKARRSLDEAAHALTPRQWQRLEAGALDYMSVYHTRTNPPHDPASTTSPDLRFDVVLVDRAGLATWIENARGFDAF